MSANPLLKGGQPTAKRTAQEWCDIGNARLAGHIPYEHGNNKGQFLPHSDVHWVVHNGVPTIEFRA